MSSNCTKAKRESFHVYFFGEAITHAWVPKSSLYNYSNVKEFKERLSYLKLQAKTKRERKQYETNISASQLESYQKAVSQADKFVYLDPDERIKQLLELLNKTHRIYSMFDDNYDDTKASLLKKISRNADVDSSQTDSEFINHMITTPPAKRILENSNSDNSSNKKAKEDLIKQEPQIPQVLLHNPLSPPTVDESILSSSWLPTQISSLTFETTFTLACPSITFVEENLILDVINRKSDGTFFGSKTVAEQTYAHMVKVNNNNRSLPISEFWFYLFVYHHLPSLFKNHPDWLNELETTSHSSSSSILDKHEQHRRQLIALMKSY
ncbi:unnamed protein product [Didymodactylos carnosus]|uniref:Uncharacterized protein n=1 Tax=Didymodactylos carnosus TaxID=1234261 RepID=A0A814G0R6_9BILA|nr:unnamed protein product [Didymodactylos carnosus]CAF0987427.1 unnamed protein product [Didymodactylos carnosus]CAF3544390.1 unnamed protein product [Didymodactylos carnosus]CAF3759579.1 unnamed protein product [Didymodactylos carnosus]